MTTFLIRMCGEPKETGRGTCAPFPQPPASLSHVKSFPMASMFFKVVKEVSRENDIFHHFGNPTIADHVRVAAAEGEVLQVCHAAAGVAGVDPQTMSRTMSSNDVLLARLPCWSCARWGQTDS